MPLRGEIRIVPHVASAFAQLVTELAPKSIALSGGDTARTCYQLLGTAANVAWPEVEVFFGDERWVSIHDPDSNEGMARLAFLDEVDPAWVHSMRHAGGDTAEEAAAAYDAELREFGPIDLIHLGLGSDGHTASLFPGSAALNETERLVVTNEDDAHPHPRLTLTFPGIARSKLVVFTLAGAGKREAFDRVRAGDDVPAARVDADQIIWLADPAAAG